MIRALQEIATVNDWNERKELMRTYLSSNEPLPEAAVRRAFVDDRYASMLVLSRGNPALLHVLLSARANAHYRQKRDTPRRSVALAAKALSSVARWAAGGFATLPAEQVAARLDVCHACPMLGPPPETLAYGIKLSSEVDMRTCQACGCVVRRKAKLPHERCPQDRWPQMASS